MGLRNQDMRLCKVQSLLEFNDYFTCPCGHVDLLVSLGKWKNKRSINDHFFVIPCGSIYNRILGRLF